MKELNEKPNHVTYDILLNSYIETEEYAKVDEILALFAHKSKQFKIPEATLKRIHKLREEKLIVPTNKNKFHNHNSYQYLQQLERLAEEKNYNKMEEILAEIPKNDLRRDHFSCLLKSFSGEGNIEKTKSYYEMLVQFERNGQYISMIDTNYYMMSFIRNAEKFDTMPKVVRIQQIFNSIAKPITLNYNTLMLGYLKRNMFKKVEEIYTKMTNPECKPNSATYAIMVRCYALQNSIDRLLNYFNSIIQHYEEKSKMTGESRRCGKQLYRTMMGICAWKRQTATVQEMFDEFPQYFAVDGKPEKQSTLDWNNLLLAYANIGDVDRVEEIYKQIPSPDEATEINRQVAYRPQRGKPSAFKEKEILSASNIENADLPRIKLHVPIDH